MNLLEFFRQFRVGEYAIFDFVVAFVGVWLLSPLLSKIFLKIRIDIPKQNWLFLTLPLSILFHLIFRASTPLTKDFISIGDHYILKIVIILLFILGVKGIKIVKKGNSLDEHEK